MKNLGRTIDKIIQVEPELGAKLIPIKNKWKRYPAKAKNYWEELIEFLNKEPLLINHPKRTEISGILHTKKKKSKKILYSFEDFTPNDKVIGAIPQNMADEIRRQDRQSVEIAKMHVQSGMTNDIELLAKVNRKEFILDIKTRKLWLDLKDYFSLWSKSNNYTVKNKGCILMLVELPLNMMMKSNGGEPPPSMMGFLKFLGVEPPPEGPQS